MSKRIMAAWYYPSSSGAGDWETLLWSDGSLSCGCPGWTRRNGPGGRTCKHVRQTLASAFELGSANRLVYFATVEAVREARAIAASRVYTPTGNEAKVVQRIYALENPERGIGRLFDFE